MLAKSPNARLGRNSATPRTVRSAVANFRFANAHAALAVGPPQVGAWHDVSLLPQAARFYAGRAVGRDCDHRCAGGSLATGDSSGPRVGPPQRVHEPSQTDRAGGPESSRRPAAFPHWPRRAESALGL